MTQKLIAVLLASGAMLSAWADTWTDPDTGYTWTYRIRHGEAEIYGRYDRDNRKYIIAVSPDPEGALTIPATLGGKPVTTVGDHAFHSCGDLTNVTIPDGVTTLGNSAFYSCTNITDITIPDSVTVFGLQSFCYCSSLKNVRLGDRVTRIEQSAFAGCSALQSIKLPESVSYIGSCAFYGCVALKDVIMSIEPERVREAAFCRCDGLADTNGFVVVNGVLYSYIGTESHIDVPYGVRRIDGRAFQNDVKSKMTSVSLPSTLESIGETCFARCEKLEIIEIPQKLMTIENGAFLGCISLREFRVAADNRRFKTMNGLLCDKGGTVVFACPGIMQSVTIPNGVLRIDAYAFCECRNLCKVKIPDSVVSVGSRAFVGCEMLGDTETLFPLTVVDGWVVEGYGSPQGDLSLSGIRGIAEEVFIDCSELSRLTIPDCLKTIGSGAFGSGAYGHYNALLDSVDVPGLEMIDGWVVNGEYVEVAETGQYSLGRCDEEGIWDLNLYNCRGLTGDFGVAGIIGFIGLIRSVILPEKMKSIESGTFTGYGGLEYVQIPCGVTIIGGGMNGGAFQDCTDLKEIALPDTVAVICDYAFYGSGLTNVFIPSSVEWLGANAFGCCANLKKAYLPRTLEGRFDRTVFMDCDPDLEIEYYDVVPRYEFIVGAKKEFDIELVGYKVTGLPSGLKYDAKKGVVSGSAKVAGEYEATFTKTGEEDVTVMFVVREEEVSVGCVGLSGGLFTAGVAGSEEGIPLEIESETDVKSVAVTKLPAGMKYDTKTGLIIGAPTKPGDYAVTVTVTTKSGAKRTETIAISVAALPDTVVGVFNGFVKTEDGEENLGTFQLTATDAGKLTAKVATAAGSYSFSGACWDKLEDGVYSATLATKKGELLTLALDSKAGWNENQLTGTFAPGTRDACPYPIVARKNAFGKTWHFAADGNERDGWRLSYAENAKAAALTVTLNADGSTKIAGKLGTLSVSASGYADVTRLSEGVIIADFAPVVSVKIGKSTLKRVLSIGANLWFDRSNEHAYIGSIHLQ